jgi:hypothetical protein
MMPNIGVNYVAVLVCAIVAMPVGFLWFGRCLARPGLDTWGLEICSPIRGRWRKR